MEKRKISGKFAFFFLIILPFLITFTIFFLRNKKAIMEKSSSLLKKEKTLEIAEIVKYEGHIDGVNIFKDNIVSFHEARLQINKSDGSLVKDKSIDDLEPFFYVGKKYIYIVDKYNGNISYYDGQGEKLKDQKLDKSILDIREVGDNLIYHLKSQGDSLLIANQKNDILFNEEVDFNILTYDAKDDTVAIGGLKLEGEVILNEVYIYGEERDRLDLGRETPLYIKVIGKNDIVVLTDENLFRYKDGEYIFNLAYDFIKDIEVNDNKIHIIYNNVYEIVDFEGELLSHLEFEESYDSMEILGSEIFISNKLGFKILNGDKIILEHFEANEKVIPRENKIYLFGEGNLKIYLIVNKI